MSELAEPTYRQVGWLSPDERHFVSLWHGDEDRMASKIGVPVYVAEPGADQASPDPTDNEFVTVRRDDLEVLLSDEEVDRGRCAYLARYENRPDHDPEAVCSYGDCEDEPSCVTDVPPGGWATVRLRAAIDDAPIATFGMSESRAVWPETDGPR